MFRLLTAAIFILFLSCALEAKAKWEKALNEMGSSGVSARVAWMPHKKMDQQLEEKFTLTSMEQLEAAMATPVIGETDMPSPSSASSSFLQKNTFSLTKNSSLKSLHFVREGKEFFGNVFADYKNYYTWKNGFRLLVAVGLAAPLANTEIDMQFNDWYQKDVRSEGLDDIASFWKFFGSGEYTLPIWGCLGLAAILTTEDCGWLDTHFGEYNKNVIRSYLVGAPPMLFMQLLLGGDRPSEGDVSWTPFQHDHSVSGHAFMGATPFIMAAKMSEKRCLKVLFYSCSTFPAWSRLNDEAHSLSQIALGWFMAYMACDSVCQTNAMNHSKYQITPILTPDTVGANLTFQF